MRIKLAVDATDQALAKLDTLSTMAAEDLFARGKKKWRAAMIVAPPWTFIQKLVFQLGVLDGRRGWLIARYSARYTWLKYRKLGELIARGSTARNAAENSERKSAQP